MRRANPGSRTLSRASAAGAALALCTLPTAWGQAPSDGPEGGAPVGVLTIPAEQSELGGAVVEAIGRLLGWGTSECDPSWGELSAGLVAWDENAGDRAWSVLTGGSAGFAVEAREGASMPVAQAIAFDFALECNALREGSPQPFSRTGRGRALDALQIDNARRARLTGIYADPDDRSELTLVFFSESRGMPAGRWRALPLATIGMAPTRGDPAPPRPVELDFGEQWGGMVFAAADLALGLDPESETISTQERFDDWGMQKLGALRSLAAGFDGRVWLWPGEAEGAVVCSLPLQRGWTDRRVADALRAALARRLAWGRDESGRATGTLALVRGNRPAGEGDRTLSLRFISIAERMTLTIATDGDDLDRAPVILADIPQ